MSGRMVRLGRLFNPKSGRSLMVPADHGMTLGSVEGLEEPRALLSRLESLGVDATILGPGVTRMYADLFASRTAPARAMALDLPLLSSIPGQAGNVSAYALIASVQDALRAGVECVKVLLIFGTAPAVIMENLRLIGMLARECEANEMPLMVEPVLWGDLISDVQRSDASIIAHACRIAVEVGADILKGPFVADTEALASIVRNTPIPIVLLGGPKVSDQQAILNIAASAIEAGVRGICFGRNVFQQPNVQGMIRALHAVVHGGQSAAQASRLLQADLAV